MDELFTEPYKNKSQLDYLYSPDLKNTVVQLLPFKILLAVNKKLSTPVYQQISNKLVSLIQEGIIRPGSLLPSSREMAATLQLHRKTIVAAYQELSAQDWITPISRKGMLVSENLPQIKPRSFKANTKTPSYGINAGFPFIQTDLPEVFTNTAGAHRLIIDDGFPDARQVPVSLLLKEYNKLFQQTASRRRQVFGDQAGALHLRTAIIKFLAGTRGIHCTENNIIVTRGAQMALYLAAHMIIKPGSTVVVAEPNYNTANILFRQAGATLVKVPADENGIDVDAIEKLCRKKKPDLLYIIPHHHHPTTVTLSSQRRMKLLELIRQYGLPVIEDDYDYDFHYNSSPILPLASADHNGNVMYIGSLTKSMSSSVKLGYMIAPANFISETLKLRRLIDIRGDSLTEEAMAVLFNNGEMEKHLKKSLKLYHQRRDLFCSLLTNELGDTLSFDKPAGGMAIWARFNKKDPLARVSAKASSMGLYMSDGRFYNSGNTDLNAIRMGFASLNEKEMYEIVQILKRVSR